MSALRDGLLRQVARGAALPATLRGMLWMGAAGLLFCLLSVVMRMMALALDPLQTQFLRYLFGGIVMIPLVLRAGWRSYRPNGIAGQAWRGVVHTAGLLLWFLALPHIPLADMTAIGFTTPIFVMLGAVLLLGERVIWARWAAALAGLAGVLVVILPKAEGTAGLYSLVMLASCPLFAASFLITKALTRRDRSDVIVLWQTITVTVFSLPFAIPGWQWPGVAEYGWFLLCGLLGSAAHYCTTQALRVADTSATQPVKFLDLAWMSALGFLVFGDVPTASTLAGGAIVFAAASWIARREARAASAARKAPVA